MRLRQKDLNHYNLKISKYTKPAGKWAPLHTQPQPSPQFDKQTSSPPHVSAKTHKTRYISPKAKPKKPHQTNTINQNLNPKNTQKNKTLR